MKISIAASRHGQQKDTVLVTLEGDYMCKSVLGSPDVKLQVGADEPVLVDPRELIRALKALI